MNRDQICLEQSNFCQAKVGQTRGLNVWLPVGDRAWMFFELAVHNKTLDGVDCYDNPHAYIATCAPGQYIVPLVGESGLSFPGGNWSSGLASNGWRYIGNVSITSRNLRLTVPAGTTRLYMNALNGASFGKMNVTVVSGSASLVKEQWDLNSTTGQDFTGERAFLPTIYRPNYFTWELIATDCGGAVLNFIGNGTTPDAINCAGFICVKDGSSSSEANPLDGVFVPSSLYEITPYRPGGQGQIAEGPLLLKFASGRTAAFWWGLGHWSGTDTSSDPDDTLINESETLYYQNESNDWVDWTTVDTDETWVRVKAQSFGRVLKGDMQTDTVDNNTASSDTRFTFGTYTGTYSFTSSGMTVTLDHLFNAAAASNGLVLSGSYGGYGGQWSIAKSRVKTIRIIPEVESDSLYYANQGAYTNQLEVLRKFGSIGLVSGNQGMALFSGDTVFSRTGGTVYASSPSLALVERAIADTATPNEFMKIYSPIMYGGTDVALANGDRITGRHTRTWTVSGGLDMKQKKPTIVFSN